MKEKPILSESEVVDTISYNLWKKAKEGKFYTKNVYVLSNGNEVNGNMYLKSLLDLLCDCDKVERNKVLKWFKKWKLASKKVQGYYNLAFGIVDKKSKNVFEPTYDDKQYKDLCKHKAVIIQMLSSLYTPKEVLKVLQQNCGQNFTNETIERFKKQYSAEIESAKNSYLDISGLSEVRLFHTRPRVEEITEMFVIAKERYLIDRTVENETALLKIFQALKKETEIGGNTTNNVLNVNVAQTTANIHNGELIKELPIKDIVAKHLADKMGVSTNKLIAGLNKRPKEQFNEDGKIQYPSDMDYDFEKLAATIKENDKDYIEAIEIEPKDIKEKLRKIAKENE